MVYLFKLFACLLAEERYVINGATQFSFHVIRELIKKIIKKISRWFRQSLNRNRFSDWMASLTHSVYFSQFSFKVCQSLQDIASPEDSFNLKFYSKVGFSLGIRLKKDYSEQNFFLLFFLGSFYQLTFEELQIVTD